MLSNGLLRDWLTVWSTGASCGGGMIEWVGTAAGVELRPICSMLVSPPKRLCDLVPFVAATACWPAAAAKGFDLVFLCAAFSRSSIFCLNFLASLSSAKERPARQPSSSKE